MTDEELAALLQEHESDRVERTVATKDGDKIREAVCAFANDMPDHQRPGVLFVGANDDGSCGNLQISDQLLQNLASVRADGNITPFPSLVVQKRAINGCQMAVVIVSPSYDPPVRFKGRVWIRVGPRRAIASPEEERRLAEKRRARDVPFDLTPVRSATINDLDLDFFTKAYLPSAVAPEIVEKNERTVEEQLLSLRFISRDRSGQLFPTITGLIVIGKEPQSHIPSDYIQFIRFAGTLLTDPIKDSKEINGPLVEMMQKTDEVFKAHIGVETDITSDSVERRRPDFPLVALQQITRNAIMHRNYEGSNAPTRLNWFTDRIEILSPGGPFGQVSIENFGTPGLADYRNAHVAEAMKVLGYVQRFGVGIATANDALRRNGNPEIEFNVQATNVLAVLKLT